MCLNFPEGASPLYVPISIGKVLASGKLVIGDGNSEGSQTAKVCTDEQVEYGNYMSFHIRRIGGIVVWVSSHITAKPKEYKKDNYVDATGIDGRNRLLPGEVLE